MFSTYYCITQTCNFSNPSASKQLVSSTNRTTMAWVRLVRFVDEEGRLCYGEPQIDQSEDLPRLLGQGNLLAREILGDYPFSASLSNNFLRVKKLVGPLSPDDVPIIRCIGLNYGEHSRSRSIHFHSLLETRLSQMLN